MPREEPPATDSRTTGKERFIWNGSPDDPTVVRVSAAGRCTDTETPEGALCRLRDSGGFGLCRSRECVPSTIDPLVTPAWKYETYCALTVTLHGGFSDGNALIAHCSDNPYDLSNHTWRGPGGEGRVYRFTPGPPVSTEELYHRYGFSVQLSARPDWVLGTGHQTADYQSPRTWSAVDLTGGHPEVRFEPVALLTSARERVTSAAQGSKVHWLQGAPHRLVGAVPLEGGRVFLAILNVARGAIEGTRVLDGDLVATPIADEHGNVFLGLERATGLQVVRLDNQLRLTHHQVTGARPVAVFDGTLVLDSGAVLGAMDLSPRYTVPAPFTQVFLGPGHVTLLRHVDGGGSEVTVLDRASGTRVAQETVPFRSKLAPRPTDSGTLLLVRQSFWRQPEFDFHNYTQTWIHEVGRGGGAHPVTLRAAASGWRELLLLGGMLVATEVEDLHNNYNPLKFQLGFSLPEVRAPRHGWSGERGGTRGMFAPE